MNVAVIPARGGSKRIPRKNLREFCGKPMIAWSIEVALESGLFDLVVVSTDCDEIAEVATRFGATVPFRRPPHLSDDFTPTIPVVRHAIDWLISHGRVPDAVCCLYATSPMTLVEDLKQGQAALLADTSLDFAFAVTAYAFPIQRALKVNDGVVEMFQPQHELTRSQDLPPAWHDAGQFYWGTANAFRKHDGFYSARSTPVFIPLHRVQDIDTPDDWYRAELMFQSICQEKGS